MAPTPKATSAFTFSYKGWACRSSLQAHVTGSDWRLPATSPELILKYRLTGEFIIHIENKLWAGEGYKQTDREWGSLQDQAELLGADEESVYALFSRPMVVRQPGAIIPTGFLEGHCVCAGRVRAASQATGRQAICCTLCEGIAQIINPATEDRKQ